jgi:cytidylate kinase
MPKMPKPSKATIASENDLEHARADPAFRHQLMAEKLDMLLSELNRLRTKAGNKPETDRHIREGANLAVKLAERLQSPGTSRKGD